MTLELLPPLEHRPPIDAAEVLSNSILAAQPGYESHLPEADTDLTYAWDILNRHNAYCGIEPSVEQTTRLIVRATQIARDTVLQEWYAHVGIGERVAYLLMNRKLPMPDIKLRRSPFIDALPGEIYQYVEAYYEPKPN